MCHVSHFGGRQVTPMKPIEPQGHLSKRNKISECYNILKYYDLKLLRSSTIKIITKKQSNHPDEFCAIMVNI